MKGKQEVSRREGDRTEVYSVTEQRYTQLQNRGILSYKTEVYSVTEQRYTQLQNRGILSYRTEVYSVTEYHVM